jgi:putative multiple sugar transport system ATP-binding protein
LLDLLLSLKASGVSCILISHKLNEVIQVADEITVLRDGKTVITLDASTQSVSEEEIIRHMVGRELHDRYPKRTPVLGAVTLEVRDWTVYHPKQPELKVIDGVSFELKQGEILGIAGLMGAGRTELAMSLFGRQYGSHASGQILLDGLEIDTSTVGLAIEKGLAYVTEDRKGLGLVLSQNTVFNATLSRLEAVSKGQVLDAAKEHQVADRFRQQLQIRCPSLETRVMHLSGGNQQKVVLAKWLFTEPRVLILDEPTRGIDVGAKYEIYTIIAQLAAQGQSILMISSELPELLGMCDRIMVLDQGRKVADFPIHEATQERIMTAILASEENLTCH